MTYYSTEQFIHLTHEISKGILADIRKEHPGQNTETYITTITKHNGVVFDYRDNDLIGMELNDDKPIVYKTTYQSGKHICNRVNIIFDVKNVMCRYNPILVLEENDLEFTSYEDYLKFFTEAYHETVKEHCGRIIIQTLIEGTRISVPAFLMDKLRKSGYVGDIGEYSLDHLEGYQGLPTEVKKKFNEWLGAFTVIPSNVGALRFPGYVEITLDLEHLLKENCQTDQWDDKIQNVLKTESIDLSVTSDE